MRKLIATLALLLSASGASCVQPTPLIDVSGLTEASMNFDQEGVGPFLNELSRSLNSNLDVGVLTKAIDSLPVDQTGNWEHSVTWEGKTERLVVVAFKDDIDSPDLAFYSSPDLATRIQTQLESFAKAQGW